jgi:L-alanine-DL-glutamate epimerase-like enolase superfamily enzyme
MALYDLVRELPLEIEDIDFVIAERAVSPEFTRRTTTVHLRNGVTPRGAMFDGAGEDVTYDGTEHEPHKLAWLELRGSWTIESLSTHLDEHDLFPKGEPGQPAYRDYRRWAFESAALDLALQQAGRPLGDVIGREARPVTFVSSTRASTIDGWLELYPSLHFKLDPTPDWTDELMAELAARGNVDVADLKGAYHGTVVDNPPNPVLYRRVAEALPGAWIEDPALTPETDAVLEPHRDRITWDAPIHSWADVEALPFPPRCLNSKPSRFGSVERLFEFYDRCAEHGIQLYGGGQFELGVGRGQIQLLAALFHPDSPNDTAPGGYNSPEPLPGLPESPLDPSSATTGFQRTVS